MKYFLAATLVVVAVTTALWLWPPLDKQGASAGRDLATRPESAAVDKVAQAARGGILAVSRWLELATDRPTAAAPASVDADPTSATSQKTAPPTARPTELPHDAGATPEGGPPSTARPTKLPRPPEAPSRREPVTTDLTVYSAVDTEIVPPEFVRPQIPKDPPPGVRLEDLPMVELAVSATGEVKSVRLVTRPVRVLPAMMLSAVKHWRFRPALKDGHPVSYRLRLRLTNQ